VSATFVCGGSDLVRILERKPTEWTVNWRSTLPQHDRMRRRNFLIGGLAPAAPSSAYETDDNGGGGMVPSVSGSEGAGYEVQSLTTSGKIPCQN